MGVLVLADAIRSRRLDQARRIRDALTKTINPGHSSP